MKKLIYTSMSIALLYIAGCAGDAGKKENKSPEQNKVQGKEALSDTDMDFVTHAGHGNAAEVSEGKLAASQGLSKSVKEMGQMMVKDHSAALEELQTLGTKIGVGVPVTPNEEQKDSEHELAQLSGVEFDKKYVKAQIKEHEKTVKLFEDEAKNGSNPELKAYAEKHLPTIRHHLDMANQMKESVK